MPAPDAARSHRVGCGAAAARATPQVTPNQAVRSLQIAKTLELDPAQSAAVASLWGGYEAQLARVLEARVAIHLRISATMPNGYMGRDFAVKNFRVRALTPTRLSGPRFATKETPRVLRCCLTHVVGTQLSLHIVMGAAILSHF